MHETGEQLIVRQCDAAGVAGEAPAQSHCSVRLLELLYDAEPKAVVVRCKYIVYI